MSKSIELKPGAPLLGALIKRKDLLQRRASENLLAQAKKRTKQLCKSAGQQVEAIRLQGYKEGYGEGLQSSVMALIQGVQRLGELHQQLDQGLQEQVQAILKPLFAADEMLLSIIDGLIQRQPVPNVKRLRIYWPAFARNARHSIVQRLVAAGLEAQIVDAPDDQRLVVEWGEHLWEFDAACALVKMTDAVMLSLRHCVGIEEACAEVRRQAFEGLLGELSLVIASSKRN